MLEKTVPCGVMVYLWRLCSGCTQLIKMSSDNGYKLDYLANDMLSHKEPGSWAAQGLTSIQHSVA